MKHFNFATHAADLLKLDPSVVGLAVGGSWLNKELDEFSDLDLILVTSEKISGNKEKMLDYAKTMGKLISGFTGEHVGEPRLLICLFDDPLMHVDIKFVTLEELKLRVETPHILLDTDGQLKQAIENSKAVFPHPDYQWIEDRFWTWIHYALTKIGRREYLEAFDFLAFLRMTVLGPLLHIKHGNLPRTVRKVEMMLPAADLEKLLRTLPAYDNISLISSLQQAVVLYRELRQTLYSSNVQLQVEAEEKVMEYFTTMTMRQ